MRPESLERADIKSLLTSWRMHLSAEFGYRSRLNIQGECELSKDVKIVFYRVAQEALNNISSIQAPGRLSFIWIVTRSASFMHQG